MTEHEVYEAIEAGATTVKALNRQLGIGAQCGVCVGCAKMCLSNKHEQRNELPDNVFSIIKQEAA